mmetsp:Transcript_22702/g.44796  ORF Transcript_22702/g.44796 Transcript_22702/m.44796 type:complete len:142 (-) Transcript_22702:849-1274(-)
MQTSFRQSRSNSHPSSVFIPQHSHVHPHLSDLIFSPHLLMFIRIPRNMVVNSHKYVGSHCTSPVCSFHSLPPDRQENKTHILLSSLHNSSTQTPDECRRARTSFCGSVLNPPPTPPTVSSNVEIRGWPCASVAGGAPSTVV